jgi:hypothetical protein
MSIDTDPLFRGAEQPITEPRPGQVISQAQIVLGRHYIFRGLNKGLPEGVVQPLTALTSLQYSKTNRTFVKFSVDHPEGDVVHPQTQTTMTIFLSDVGITENGTFKPGTSIWLEEPEELPQDS